MGIENIENNGQETSLDIGSDDDPTSLSLILTAAKKCKTRKAVNNNESQDIVDVVDADPMTSSANSSNDAIVDSTRGETVLVTSRQMAGAVDNEEALQIAAVNFVSATTITNTTGNNDAAFHVVPEIASNIALDANLTIDHEPQDLIIHEAFLLEMTDEDDVIVATHFEPTLPWWKQKQMQLLLSGLLLFDIGQWFTPGSRWNFGSRWNLNSLIGR